MPSRKIANRSTCSSSTVRWPTITTVVPRSFSAASVFTSASSPSASRSAVGCRARADADWCRALARVRCAGVVLRTGTLRLRTPPCDSSRVTGRSSRARARAGRPARREWNRAAHARDVVGDRAGEQTNLLRHVADADVAADLAAMRPQHAGDQAGQRGLAAAARPGDQNAFARRQRQTDIPDGCTSSCRRREADPIQLDTGRGCA